MKKKLRVIFKRLKLRTYIALGLIVVFIPILLISLFKPSSTKATWYDEYWAYRAKVPVTAHPSVETNVYITTTINTSDTNKFQADCGDLRFTDINGKLLPYYISSGCSSASTVVHIFLTNFPNWASDYYYYYGNPSAANGFESSDFATAASGETMGSVGSEEKGIGPVSVWHMDEGVDGTCSGGTNDVCDAIVHANDGAISNGTAWQTSDKCVGSKCLWFDGSDDVVTISNANNIELDKGLSGGFTLEAWIRPNGAGEGTGGQIFFKGTNTWIKVTNLSSNKLDVSASVDLATTDATVTASAAVTNNQWTHVTLSYTDDGDDEISIWVNGKLTATSTNGVGSLSADANSLLIGGTTTNNFSGFIDEVKVYNSEKTATQLAADYNKIGSTDYATANLGRADSGYLSSGILGYWNLDENSGNVTDYSGNATTLTNNGTTTFTYGKFGNAPTFNGSSKYFSTASTISNVQTISFWVYPASTTDNFINLVSTTVYISASSGTISATGVTTPTIYVNGVISSTITASAWSLVTVTTGTAISASQFEVGRANGSYAVNNSKMDEVRLYNRALSAGEVRNLYAWKPGPVGEWKMDEGTGSTVYDTSGNGSNATIAATGKYYAGRYGNGVYVKSTGTTPSLQTSGDIGSLDIRNGNFTVSLWQNFIGGNAAATNYIFSKRNTATGYSLAKADNAAGAGVITFYVSDGTNTVSATSGNSINDTATSYDNGWYYLTGVVDRDAGIISLYINGILDQTASITFGDVNSTDNLEFGCSENCSAGTVEALLDDARVYNYALTKDQIASDMQNDRSPNTSGRLAGYWKLDSIVNSKAKDNSPFNETQWLKPINSPTIDTSAKVNNGITFNGTSQYLTSADSIPLSITGSLSLSAWIKPSANTAATRYPIAGKATPSTISYLLEQFGDEIRMYIGSSSNYVTTNTANLQTGTWYYVTAVYSSVFQTVTIYINGRQYATTTTGTIPTSITDSNNGFAVGADDGDLTYYITDTADDSYEAVGAAWVSTTSVNAVGQNNALVLNQGIRYQSIAIAQASTINAASVIEQREKLGGGNLGYTVTARVFADDVDNAAAYSSGNRPSGITETTAFSSWNFINAGSQAIGYEDVSITSVVQEVIDRAGWASGNAMRFAVKNNGTANGNAVGFNDYSFYNNRAAILTINVNSASTKYFSGSIDDVKLYSGTISLEQILTDMNAGSSTSFAANANSEASTLTGGAGSYPVGYFPLDENKGTATVYDVSGSSNDLTINGSPSESAWQSGKVGSSILLDGSNDTLSRADDADFDFGTASFTVQAWAKHVAIATNPDYLITKADTTNGGYKLYMDSTGNYCFAIDDDATWTPDDSACTAGTDYGDSAWHHVVGVKNGTSSISIYVDGILKTTDASLTATGTLSNTNTFYIGADRDGTSNTWAGYVDEVKLYNYLRTTSQIAYDYNRGGPLMDIKFDECQGSTAYDVSGYNKHVLIQPGASGNTAVGTCNSGTSTDMWNDGKTGKFNSSLGFDGTDDYASATDSAIIRFDDATNDFSIFLWAKRTTTGTEYLVSKEDADNDGWRLMFNSSNQVVCSEDATDVTSTNTITDTNWHFVGCTIDRDGNGQVYIDGRPDGSTVAMGSDAMATTTDLTIGTRSYTATNYFNGLIDVLNLYNYALSGTQVTKLMNQNSGARFGPLTGTPSP